VPLSSGILASNPRRGFSHNAAAVRPGRDSEPVVSSPAREGVGDEGLRSRRAVRWLLLVLRRSVLPVRIGSAASVLRPLLTSASPTTACTAGFQAFGQALLPGAGQISPDKNVICRRASSCFTCEAVWERLRGVVPTRLAAPAL
jgi:hypothetical protein